MKTENSVPKNIDEYIALCPQEIQLELQKLREIIRNAAPDAVEGISYQMPVFKLNGNLVYFAALKNHIGFYPGSACIEIFKNDLKGYKSSKGAVQFPFRQPVPYDVIEKIVLFRVAQNLDKVKLKK